MLLRERPRQVGHHRQGRRDHPDPQVAAEVGHRIEQGFSSGGICDALQPPATRPINLSLLRGRAEPGVTVTDNEVRAAQRFAFTQLHLVVEPGGAAALAAALAGKVPLDSDTVVMLTGGNVDPAAYAATIAGQ